MYCVTFLEFTEYVNITSAVDVCKDCVMFHCLWVNDETHVIRLVGGRNG